jgi:hypoxanthine-DNA glycosylase
MVGQKLKTGFPPVYNENSRVLILGSFPSVKSREISFYYGNKQNRFWKMLCGFFQGEIPKSVGEKKAFLLEKGIALWDMVTACEIQGSSDSSIKNAEVAELETIFNAAKIEKILLNGTLAYDLFFSRYSYLTIPYVKMPSTSPANPRYDQEIWWRELREIY